MSADVMMDRDVANPLRMLSAYLMTTATTNPPMACRQSRGERRVYQHAAQNTVQQKHMEKIQIFLVDVKQNTIFKPAGGRRCK